MSIETINVFRGYLESDKTRKLYTFLLQRFVNHYNLESFDSILVMNGTELQKKIELYVILLKETKSKVYARCNIFAIKAWCDANDKIDVNWKKITRLIKKPKSRKTRPYISSEIKRMVNSIKEIRGKAVILFLSASGVRIGSLPVLKMKDLKQMPFGCIAVTAYAGSDEEYTTFINKEANDALTLYFEQRKHEGEVITPDSTVFMNKAKKPMSEYNISNFMIRVKRNACVNFEGTPNLLCHAFRRRWNTIMKMREGSNGPLIERMLGHDMQLDNSYFQPTEDQLFTEYCKGMADLTIDDSERLLVERAKIEAERSQLEKEVQQNRELENRMKQYESNQNEMMRLMNMVKNGYATIEKTDNDEITLKLTKKAIS